MGKKSRAKKQQKQWTSKRPDRVLSYGPLQIEQYGRHVRFHNASTPEQHAAFLEKIDAAHKAVIPVLEENIVALQQLVKKYDALELMHRAAYVLLQVFVKNRTESEIEDEESYSFAAVEYIQYLIARTEANSDGKHPSEAEWGEVWSQTIKVLRLTQNYLLSRKRIDSVSSEINSLRVDIDLRRLMVRVKRYPVFFIHHLSHSLAPYKQYLKEIYGASLEEIIEGMKQINEHQKTGVAKRYKAFHTAEKALTNKLIEQGYSVDPNSLPDEIERTRAALKLDPFKTMLDELQEKTRLTFTPAIFDITDLVSLPKPFLSLLSVKPGEAVLKSLTGLNNDDLSPLSTSILHYKPFLEVNDRFYAFYHSGFEDRIVEIIERDLFGRKSELKAKMIRKRSENNELIAKQLLCSIINPDFSYLNVYYPNPDDNGNLTELDLLMGVDDILFIVEVKSGGISEGTTRGAPASLLKDLSNLIIEGQRQSERAEKYITSKDEVGFFDQTGKQLVCKIKHDVFRKIFRIVITREDLGWVGAKIAILSIIDPGLTKSYPWHVSIDDLTIIEELFKKDEIRFEHYLEQRLAASAEKTLEQSDEIEHVALYNELNQYHQLPVSGMNRVSFAPSYTQKIDRYFMDKSAGEFSELPTQKMPSKMKEFIGALASSKLHGRFEVGSIILSLDESARVEFNGTLENLDAAKLVGKQRTYRMPFTFQSVGLSVTRFEDKHWLSELKRSAIQMEASNCKRWLVVQLADKHPYTVTKIEVILPNRFSDQELAAERLHNDVSVSRRIAFEKPGRNDGCPCGSGKKFKDCHGR